jgi:hypothetical protein
VPGIGSTPAEVEVVLNAVQVPPVQYWKSYLVAVADADHDALNE